MDARRLADVSNATPEQKGKILDLASEIRKFEIERFWQRSLFFWGFIAAAFVAYAQTYEKNPFIAILVACYGTVCSTAWTLGNRGSKYWQEAWEQKVKVVEKDVLGVDLFSNPEPRERKGFWGAAEFSVSRLAIALSDFTVLIWIVLLAKATYYANDWSSISRPWSFPATVRLLASLAVIAFSAVYVGLLVWRTGPWRPRGRPDNQLDLNASRDAAT